MTTEVFIIYNIGVAGTSCIYPIDMIKTRLQASKGLYKGPLHCLQSIYAAEGIGGFYRGLFANLIGVIPEKAIKLAANEYFRELFERDDGSIALHHEVLSGGLAGFCQVIATNPMEITKIRLQMQSTLPVAERQSMSQVVSSLGLRGMYQGTLATLSRDVPYSFIFFPLYANIKAMMANSKGETSMLGVLTSGIISGAIAAATVTPTGNIQYLIHRGSNTYCCYTVDVVKTRLQLAGGKEKYKSVPNAYRMIIKEEGFGALYKGAVPRMVVVGPLFGITLLAFEAQKNYMIKKGML